MSCKQTDIFEESIQETQEEQTEQARQNLFGGDLINHPSWGWYAREMREKTTLAELLGYQQ